MQLNNPPIVKPRFGWLPSQLYKFIDMKLSPVLTNLYHTILTNNTHYPIIIPILPTFLPRTNSELIQSYHPISLLNTDQLLAEITADHI